MPPTNKLVEDALSENKVVVFSKTYCPYCTKAKRLLDFLNVKYESFELDERLDGQAIQDYLKEKTGQRTVPNIFINGQHLGGSDKLHEAHASGKLQLLLAPGPELVAITRTSRRIRQVVESPELWRHCVISEQVLSATAFVEKALCPRAEHVKGLTLVDVCAPPLLPPDNDLSRHLVTTFFAALDTLLSKCGNNLHTLVISDTDESFFFSNFNVLFESVAQYARHLKRIVLAGTEETVYVGDSNMLILIMGCGQVEEFVDAQAFGMTAPVGNFYQLSFTGLFVKPLLECPRQALNMMVDGWKSLRALSLNTELQHIRVFTLNIGQFRSRLKSLSVTHFWEPLNAQENLFTFAEALKKLPELSRISIDLQMTKFADGLRASDWEVILDACPNVREVEYMVCIEAYFEDMEEVALSGTESTATFTGEYLHSWSSDDSKTLLDRARVEDAKHTTARQRLFFHILDEIKVLCKKRRIRLLLKWSI
ncbi:hypothetical protein SpCBS45565_g02336 [Spizellomyces sp. 'palustris']|nr:hypothetical protein SpCBS45565_g02336 [Spizellomyces sp. 'palustris']